jgi:hypothetical protein
LAKNWSHSAAILDIADSCSIQRPTEQVATEMPQQSSETASPTRKVEATSSQIGGFTAIPTSPQETPLVSSTPEVEGIPMLNIGSNPYLELQEKKR